jgi:hypothetical protein
MAACSGSFGSGSTGPVPLASLGGNANPQTSPSPTAATAVLTYGESTAFQPLPQVGEYSGSIAFPKQPPPTPDPKAKTPGPKDTPTPSVSPTAEAISIGATFSIQKLDEGPDVNFLSGKGKKKKSRELPARALAYIKLLPTHDATLASYPRIEVDIPRELAAQYRDGEFGLALWNSGEKDSAYRLNVAARDESSPAPLASRAPATAAPTPTPSPSPSGSASPGATPVGQRPNVASAAATPGLPPQRLIFLGTEKTLKLVANRPLIFALYALPHPSVTPTPIASATAKAAKGAAPAASGSPAAEASGEPAAAASAAAEPAAAAGKPATTPEPEHTPESHDGA